VLFKKKTNKNLHSIEELAEENIKTMLQKTKRIIKREKTEKNNREI